MQYLKGKAVDRKGVGMELALLVLLVVFACSTLLVSAALMGRENLQQQQDRLQQRLTLDSVAEQAMKDPKYEHESYAVTRGNNTITICHKENEDQVLLTIAWDDGKIIQWEYH